MSVRGSTCPYNWHALRSMFRSPTISHFVGLKRKPSAKLCSSHSFNMHSNCFGLSAIMAMSSAYKKVAALMLPKSNFNTVWSFSGSSFIKNAYSTGLRIDPCNNPVLLSIYLDTCPCTATCDLLLSNSACSGGG